MGQARRPNRVRRPVRRAIQPRHRADEGRPRRQLLLSARGQRPALQGGRSPDPEGVERPGRSGSTAAWTSGPTSRRHSPTTRATPCPATTAAPAGLHYRDQSGRNDLVACKVARDAEDLFFYARTRQTADPTSDPNWMWLLIDTDSEPQRRAGKGYDFIVNRSIEGDGTTWLEKNDGGWRWKPVAKVRVRAAATSSTWRSRVNRIGISPRARRTVAQLQVGRQPPAPGRRHGLLHQRRRRTGRAVPVSVRRRVSATPSTCDNPASQPTKPGDSSPSRFLAMRPERDTMKRS